MEDSELIWGHLDCLDDSSWALDENILAQRKNNATTDHSAAAKNSKSRKNKSKISDEKRAVINAEEAASGLKKLDHNAKERVRRMKINASFLALRALLPDSRRSKKKWSAPAIVDRVLKYIPEMENEVEALKCKKENVQSRVKSNKENGQSQVKSKKIVVDRSDRPFAEDEICLKRVNEEEAIIQVCMGREDESRFTNLLQSVEDEGICINTASAIHISHTTTCYHLHIQTDITTCEDFEELREKVISWLR